MRFEHLARAVDFAGADHQHAARSRCRRHGSGIAQVLRPIGRQGGGGTHSAGQHNGFVYALRCQHAMQKPSGFFQRIGTVGDDDAADCRIGQMLLTALRQRSPHGKVHVLTVNLRNLLQQPRLATIRRTRRTLPQRLHRQLGGGIAHVVASHRCRASNRPAGAQQHPFFCLHAHLQQLSKTENCGQQKTRCIATAGFFIWWDVRGSNPRQTD